MRNVGILLSVMALLAFVGCADKDPVSSPGGPTAKLTVSELKAGGYQGMHRPEPTLYKSVLVNGLGHPTMANKSPAQIAQMLDNMGYNHVVFSGTAGYDVPRLNAVIRELHRRGIKAYGECTQFAGWYDDIAESRPTMATGELMPQIEWYQGSNPSVPAVYDRAVEHFKASIDPYPEIDGMWMDFIRWPLHWEVRDWEEGTSPFVYETSFDDATLARFEAATGIDIPNGLATVPERAAWIRANAYDQWAQWKCSIITSFCEFAHDYVKSKGANKVLGAFTVPWKVSDYDGAILKVVGQDYAAMSEWVEVWSPMEYYDMMDYTVPWLGDFATYTKQITGRTTIPIIMGFSISAGKYGDVLTPEELRASIRTTALAPGSNGVMMFWYTNIMDENRQDEIAAGLASLP